MRIGFILSREEGYTLIETVVAMALLMSILIPLGVTIGDFILDKKVNRLDLALRIAQAEMSRTVKNGDFTNDSHTTEDGLLVRRKIHRNSRLIELEILVSASEVPHNSLTVLNKSILLPQ